MTKVEVLDIFFRLNGALTPNAICRQLSRPCWPSSVYSYLYRLHKQGLLYRRWIRGRLHYQISPRGTERLRYLQARQGRPTGSPGTGFRG